MSEKNYRWKLLSHWANLTYMGGSVLAGMVFGWPVVALAALVEGAALWILPDIPVVQRSLDADLREEQLFEQREYYLREIFDASPRKASGPLSIFFGGYSSWRISTYGNEDRRQYDRLIILIEDLEGLRDAYPDRVSDSEMAQLNRSVNEWLAQKHTVLSIQNLLDRNDISSLEEEAAELAEMRESLEGDPSKQIVLNQRLLSLKQKLDQIPQLEQRKGLALIRADRIVTQMETFHHAAKTMSTPGTSAMDMLTDKQALLDFGMEEANAEVEIALLSSGVDADALFDDVVSGLKKSRGEETSRAKLHPKAKEAS